MREIWFSRYHSSQNFDQLKTGRERFDVSYALIPTCFLKWISGTARRDLFLVLSRLWPARKYEESRDRFFILATLSVSPFPAPTPGRQTWSPLQTRSSAWTHDWNHRIFCRTDKGNSEIGLGIGYAQRDRRSEVAPFFKCSFVSETTGWKWMKTDASAIG